MENTLKTTLLLGALTGLFVLVGGALGGQQGMWMMLAVAGVMNLGTWFFADTMVIRWSGAVPLTDPRLAWLVDDVRDLAQRAGMPMPKVYIVPHERSPNAFATGRSPSKGVVAVTAGLLETLDRRQIRGVLAHELGHIAHRDTLVSAVAATLAGALTIGARMVMFGGRDRDVNPAVAIALAILAPLAAVVMRMAISRTREYGADARAAAITGDPEGLAQALERISGRQVSVPMHTGSESVHYISDGFGGTMGKLLSTHPPVDERIRRLRTRR